MAEEAVAEGKSSKMIIIIIALVVLLAGGGAAYYFLVMADEVSTGEGAKAAEVIDEVEEEEDPSGELAYFDMKTPFVVDFPAETGVHLIQVSVALLTRGDEAVELLTKHEPMIRNNFLMLIRGQEPKIYRTPEGKAQLQEMMLENVNESIRKVSHKAKVRNVFFTSFVMQ